MQREPEAFGGLLHFLCKGLIRFLIEDFVYGSGLLLVVLLLTLGGKVGDLGIKLPSGSELTATADFPGTDASRPGGGPSAQTLNP